MPLTFKRNFEAMGGVGRLIFFLICYIMPVRVWRGKKSCFPKNLEGTFHSFCHPFFGRPANASILHKFTQISQHFPYNQFKIYRILCLLTRPWNILLCVAPLVFGLGNLTWSWNVSFCVAPLIFSLGKFCVQIFFVAINLWNIKVPIQCYLN